jgi:hypothetical protein
MTRTKRATPLTFHPLLFMSVGEEILTFQLQLQSAWKLQVVENLYWN